MSDDLRPVCEDYDARVFFPHRGDRKANAYAVALCRTCPLVKPCGDAAVERGERWGVWGATTERERTGKLRGAA